MRHILLLLLSVFIVSLTSCRNDFEFETSTGGLEFSKDTVYLDTVFTNIGSSTYTLKVYNRSDKDISIPSIKLGKPDSKYRLMVDGMAGTSFTDVELMAQDSMFIFVETTAGIADANPNDFLYTDHIQFSSINGVQNVELVTLIQDAVFIYPNRPLETGIKETLTINGMTTGAEGHELTTTEELHWTNEKPYVIYGYALVPNGKTLTVDAGARVHFHADSGLIVDRLGVLKINGAPSATEALENEVIFEGDRLEPGFAEVPGQWLAVILYSESPDNYINHLTLKNATVGLLMQMLDPENGNSPQLTINNSQVYNCTNFGILARKGIMASENLVMNNCGVASLALTQGGSYHFKHATIANYFNAFSQTALLLNDYWKSGDTLFVSSLAATFDNCVVYGSNNYSLSLENKVADEQELLDPGFTLTFNVNFNNCLIKLFDFSNRLNTNPLYPFDGNVPAKVTYNQPTRDLLAENSNGSTPDFRDPNNNNLRPSDETSVINAGFNAGVIVDILGMARTAEPDLGAYEYTPE